MNQISKLIPLADRVLVRRVQAVSQTAGGIILPESSQKAVNEAEVVAVGPGLTTVKGDFIPVTLEVGDKVLLPEYGLTELDSEKEFCLVRNDDVLAKFKEE